MNTIHPFLIALITFGLNLPCRAATYHVATTGNDTANGSAEKPWRTIQWGVKALKPGDTLLISPGIYRESISIARGGTADRPITLSAIPGAHVVISGADLLKDGWTKTEGDSAIHVRAWPHLFPINHRDGKPLLTHPGDLEHELTGRAEQVIHDGRLLRQVLTRQQLAPGTFFADIDAKKLYVWLRDSSEPAKADVEASTRSHWLIGQEGVSHVRLRGLTFRYAANHAQRGAFVVGKPQDRGGARIARGWVVEDCIFERANSSGGALSGEGHTFRRCVFQDNGQLGFGASFCHNTLMEECGIYRNNTKGYSTGWEAGGLKVCLSRGFVFDRCRALDNRGCGIWYDIGNEKSEVKNCYIAHNDEAGLFYEISYSLHAHGNTIINNALRGEQPGHSWGCGGITLSSSEDCIIENNILVGNRDGFAFREQDRGTPRIDTPGKGVRIFNRNHIIRNNVVAYSQAYNMGLWFDTNFFAARIAPDAKRIFEDPATLNIRFEKNTLWPLPGKVNYLYGAPWHAKSRKFQTPEEFSKSSAIPDTSIIADPGFVDVLARDLRRK